MPLIRLQCDEAIDLESAAATIDAVFKYREEAERARAALWTRCSRPDMTFSDSSGSPNSCCGPIRGKDGYAPI